MQPLSIERDVRRNGIRMDCVFEGMAFDAAREQVRTLRLSGTKLSQIAEQTGMPVEQVMDYCRELGLPEIGSCHLVPPGRVKERRCPVCGRIIGQSGRGAPRKYCSDECYAEYERRNYKREKAGRVAFCQNCGRPFILDRQEYLGHTVLCKSIRENFKLKKRRAATPEERIIFKNTHEAIIDQETWDKAQRLRKRNPKKLPSGTYSHRLAGMVFCADCGSRMSFSSPESKHRDSDVVYDSDSSWQCNKYRNMYVSCTSHFIKTSTIETAILNAIKAMTKEIIENEDEFAEQLQAAWENQNTQVSSENKKELHSVQKRIDELDALIRSLYENSVLGKIPERQYQRLMAQYSAFSLAGEVARYLNISSILAAKILREAQDGMDVILADVNQYNAVLDDIIIPTIFHALFDVTAIQKTEDRDVVLLREPKDAAYYTVPVKLRSCRRLDEIEAGVYAPARFHPKENCIFLALLCSYPFARYHKIRIEKAD